MSGSVVGGGNVASAGTVATGAVVLPFTHGSMLVSYVIIVAIVCAMIVILSKVIKNIVTHYHSN